MKGFQRTSALVAVALATMTLALVGSGSVLSPASATNGWSSPSSIDTTVLTSVSCHGETFCAAVDFDDRALTFNGSTWSPPTSLGNSFGNSVSCPTSSFCAAVDYNGNAFTFDGSS